MLGLEFIYETRINMDFAPNLLNPVSLFKDKPSFFTELRPEILNTNLITRLEWIYCLTQLSGG